MKRQVLGRDLSGINAGLRAKTVRIRAQMRGDIPSLAFPKYHCGGALMTLQNTDPDDQKYNVAVAAEVFLDYGDFIREVIDNECGQCDCQRICF